MTTIVLTKEIATITLTLTSRMIHIDGGSRATVYRITERLTVPAFDIDTVTIQDCPKGYTATMAADRMTCLADAQRDFGYVNA